MQSANTYKVASKKKSEFNVESSQLISTEKGKPHLFVQHIFPKKKLKKKIKHIIFQHGMIEYHGRHNALFDHLSGHFKEDFVISTLDLVGHGKSGGNRGHIESFDSFVDDWLIFLNHCKEKFYEGHDVETFVISHSLGGLIVLKALMREKLELAFPIKKTIFCNPCILPKLEVPKKLISAVEEYVPKLVSQLKVPLIYSAQDLTHDKEKMIEFEKDPLISKSISVNIGVETMRACEKLTGESYFYSYPSLFLISGDDRVVNTDKIEAFLSGMEKGLVEKKNYPNMRHDLLNETCRNIVFKDIIDYIEN